MNILLTNADGCDAPGLAAMREGLMQSGFNVLTVAPAEPMRRMGRATSGQNAVRMERAGGDERHPVFAVHGTPVDAVRIAVLSGLAREAAAVVSGISQGANIGDDATYSSTFGAAMEAAILGYPAMAISQQARDGRLRFDDLEEHDFGWSTVVAAELAAWLGASPPPDRSLLNVNVPGKLIDRQIKLTSLDQRIWNPSDCRRAEGGGGWLTFSTPADRDPEFAMTRGSDAMAIAHGHVSVTPVSAEFGKARAQARLNDWTRATIAQVNPRLGASGGSCTAGCCG